MSKLSKIVTATGFVLTVGISWGLRFIEFADAVLSNKPVKSGTSKDALQSMQLVFKIYYADQTWRETYAIPNPDA